MNQDIFFDRKGQKHIKPSGKEVVKRVSTDALIIKDGKILLILAPDLDFWELPGGGVEEEETPEEALKREVFEETGYKITEIKQKLGMKHTNFYSFEQDVYYDSFVNFYLATVSLEQQNINQKDADAEEIKWFNLNLLDYNLIKPFHRDIIRNIIGKGKND